MMDYILSENMSLSELMYELSELSTINVDPSESNQICSVHSALEEIMCRNPSFDIMR